MMSQLTIDEVLRNIRTSNANPTTDPRDFLDWIFALIDARKDTETPHDSRNN